MTEEVCDYCEGEKVVVVQSSKDQYPCLICVIQYEKELEKLYQTQHEMIWASRSNRNVTRHNND